MFIISNKIVKKQNRSRIYLHGEIKKDMPIGFMDSVSED